MLEKIISGLLSIFDPMVLLLIFGGIIFGLILGLLPGLGGLTVLALLMPLCFKLEPTYGIALLIAAYSVIYQGGSLTAVLLNIPGETANAATLLDGFPMTQQGRSGRAIGIAETASAMGGVFGGVVLALIIPCIRPVVMAFGSPECFMLVFMGLCFIGVVASASPIKGLIAGGLGLILSFVGYDGVSGIPRFTFGHLYLYDGIRLISLALGLFAIPEAITMITTGGTIAKVEGPITATTADVIEGIKDVFRHWGLFLRSAAIGTLVGIVPGAGGGVAVFVAYGHAKQTSKHPEKFGTGCVEGIIAPESANNAKEGGALVPTVAFGIPGSAGMALLLGALLILGLVPGPSFLEEHLDITFTMVGTLIFASIISSIGCLLLAPKLAKIAYVPGHILAPIVLVLVALGAYAVEFDMRDVLSAFIIGGLGLAMARFDYSRPALFLGYILGELAERYLHISLEAFGWRFIFQPVAFVLLIITILSIFSKSIGNLFRRLRRA
jgi:TctA family transporter